jgi:hypothetical protein
MQSPASYSYDRDPSGLLGIALCLLAVAVGSEFMARKTPVQEDDMTEVSGTVIHVGSWGGGSRGSTKANLYVDLAESRVRPSVYIKKDIVDYFVLRDMKAPTLEKMEPRESHQGCHPR